MFQVKIRPARKADGAAIRSVTAAICEAPEAARFVSERFGDVGGKGEAYGPDTGRTLVAEMKGEVIGYIAWREDETIGVVDAHAVRPDCQGWGTGTHLLTALIRRFRSSGIRQVEATVPADFTRARRLYEAQGFREIGRSVRMVRQQGEGKEKATVVPAEYGAALEQRRREGYEETGTWIHYEKRFKNKPLLL